MAKLMLSLDELMLREIPLAGARTVIGRRPTCDIRIENLAVSGVHACIVNSNGDAFVEDMGSTNGTLVNGKPVSSHRLQHNDVIGIGRYQLRYVAGAASSAADADITTTIVIQPSPEPLPTVTPDADAVPAAALQILSGPGAGRATDLVKSPFTLGRPGMQSAAIVRRGRDYVIIHAGGDTPPQINGQPIRGQEAPLRDHDVIEVAGVEVAFFFRQ
jgi:pSer/pThr/pTyr-binding forkhead associated (FHA) protein